MISTDKYHTLFDELDQFKVTQFESYISASQYLKAYELVLQYSPPSASILDWGTGTGHFSLFLLEENFKVNGFTIDEDFTLAKHLSKSYPHQYNFISDPKSVKSLPFEANSFDVVTSIGVLEHVRETGGTELDSLSEIWRILKPEGIFICYHFPNKYSWIEAIAKHLNNKYNHRYKFSRKEILAIFSKANFKIIETKRYGLLPRLIFRSFPDNLLFTKYYNYIDRLFSILLNIFCQNHYIVSKKCD